MSPLFMDTGYEPNSPVSASAEESNSNTAGSEKEGEGQLVENKGTKRREKNRDAARKTRRKQTERADELHEELQRLEQSNSALRKEIAVLKKDHHRYTTTLTHHEPYCCLRTSGSSSSSTTHLATSPSATCWASSSPLRATTQASSPTLATSPSVSTSLTSDLGPQTLEEVKNTHLLSSASAPAATTSAASSGLSVKLLSAPFSCRPVTIPTSVSFATLPAPHSLFIEEPPVTSKLTNVPPVCTSLLSTTVTSSTFTTAAQPQPGQDIIHKTCSIPAHDCFSPLNSYMVDAFLMKQTSFPAASPRYPKLTGEDKGLVARGRSMTVPQLHPGQCSGNPTSSTPLCNTLPSTPQDSTLQSLMISPQANLEPSPTPTFALNPSTQQMTPSLLSLLTVPSPLSSSQTTSASSGELLHQLPPSLPLLDDPPCDLSLSELLEVDDWILSETSNE